jgi:hypothetical protein
MLSWMSGRHDETSVLIIRAWHEPAGFRARVTVTPDVTRRDEWSVVLAAPVDVVDAVAAWAEDFAAGRPLQPPPGAARGGDAPVMPE